jgi:hypothetical protein
LLLWKCHNYSLVSSTSRLPLVHRDDAVTLHGGSTAALFDDWPELKGEAAAVTCTQHLSKDYYCNDIDNPPSTNSCAPVTYLLRSLARKTAGPAKSSGSPTRPNGVRFSRYFSFSAFARSSAASCVLVVPGSRALHLIPYLPRAHASLCIMLSTAALVGV